jgi:hypothetical protein
MRHIEDESICGESVCSHEGLYEPKFPTSQNVQYVILHISMLQIIPATSDEFKSISRYAIPCTSHTQRSPSQYRHYEILSLYPCGRSTMMYVPKWLNMSIGGCEYWLHVIIPVGLSVLIQLTKTRYIGITKFHIK